ncbi:hypothetical protein ANN_21818 [Periplaneta americana]|uniref:Immunoglobulin I-set domain-containing protein n=1 Tax=Periplaneta americana TaxID=6978 RepID=A0ABQ8S6T7_PERAM|nr:hypothetical protein ANN_21818 [Periplaneta americana]
MTRLCEGGNEPPGSLKANTQGILLVLQEKFTESRAQESNPGPPDLFIIVGERNLSEEQRRGEQELVGERYRVSENNNTVLLSLQHVTRDDVGQYSLTAKNAAGEARRNIELKVEDAGGDVPVFLRRLCDLAVKVGTRTRFLVEIRSSSEAKSGLEYTDRNPEENRCGLEREKAVQYETMRQSQIPYAHRPNHMTPLTTGPYRRQNPYTIPASTNSPKAPCRSEAKLLPRVGPPREPLQKPSNIAELQSQQLREAA